MAETVTIGISRSVGYSGKGGRKSYIAKISGTDPKYIFAREFVDTQADDPSEMFRMRRKGKGSWREAAALDAGLYEVCRSGEKQCIIVWVVGETAKWCNVSDDRAVKMAVMMSEGSSFEEARQATKAPPKVAPQADVPPAEPGQ